MGADFSGVDVTTFQALKTDLTQYAEDKNPLLREISINPADLLLVAAPAAVSVPTGATGVGVSQTVAVAANMPPEIAAIVALFQRGWGNTIGAGKKIGHWTTAVLMRDMLTAYVNQGAPR